MARLMQSAYDYVGAYGPSWRTGVLIDHLEAAKATGWTETVDGAGLQTVTLGDVTVYVVCGDIVEIPTEDGPMSGRCGGDVKAGGYACEGHTAERESWSAMSEYEKASWEREQDVF